jgi:hypothetical protein
MDRPSQGFRLRQGFGGQVGGQVGGRDDGGQNLPICPLLQYSGAFLPDVPFRLIKEPSLTFINLH